MELNLFNLKFPRTSNLSLIFHLLALGIIAHSIITIRKFFYLLTNSENPFYVATTTSMYPGINRGDILFSTWDFTPPLPGDIIVFNIPNKDYPIIHRVIGIQNLPNDDYNVLTKGDNNPVNDRQLYENKNIWIHKSHIKGRVKMIIPLVGLLVIWIMEYPFIKYFFLLSVIVLILMSLIVNEE